MRDKPESGLRNEVPEGQPAVARAGVFRLRLLGPFQLTDQSGQPIDIGSRKNRLLLALLASAPGRSMTREALAGLLWAEHGEEQARSSLRQALAVLRKELKGQDASFFAATDATIALHPAHVEIDTEALLSGARGSTRQSLEAAIELWRGPFLGDVKAGEPELEQWLRERREYFTGKYIGAMDRLVPLLEGQRRIEVAKQLVQADTLREASHRHVMEAYLAAGERPLALRHYEGLRKLLKEELGVEPSSETQALRERIVAYDVGAPAAHAPPPTAPPVTGAASIPPPAAAASVSRRRSPAVLAVAVLALIGAAAAIGWFSMPSQPVLAGPPAVAVLPFQSLSGDAGDARLAEGLTIDTITDLSRFQDFRVIAKDTTDTYKNKTVDIRQLGEDLKVSHVLKGTFQREGGHIRVTAQLVDAATGETLWSELV